MFAIFLQLDASKSGGKPKRKAHDHTFGPFWKAGEAQVGHVGAQFENPQGMILWLVTFRYFQHGNHILCWEDEVGDVRQLHNTHWGLVCPAETPEGQALQTERTQLTCNDIHERFC